MWSSPFPHRYIKNTSTCGTILIQLLLNAGRPQTSKRVENLHVTEHGKRKKNKRKRKESGWALCLWEGAVKEERFLHTGKSPH